MRVEEIMIQPVYTVGAQDDADEAWRLMHHHKCHHLVVLKDDNVVGVVSEKDLGTEGQADRRRGHFVADLMTWSVVKGGPDMDVADVAVLMEEQGMHCLPIFQGDKLVGILTATDIAKAGYGRLSTS